MTLVLSRRIDERILIGDTWLTVIEIQGNRVKLGIDASPDIKILREELIDGDKQGSVVLSKRAGNRVRRGVQHGS